MSVALLRNIICNDCLIFPDVMNKKITLPENNGVFYELDILGIPEDIFAIKADSFPDTRCFFKGKNGENKRADYILISGLHKLVIFLELKGGAGGGKGDIAKQLKGAECLLKYCDLLYVKMQGLSSTLQLYNFRFVSVCHLGSRKRPTHQQSLSLHDTPENMLRITSPYRLFFKQLRGPV